MKKTIITIGRQHGSGGRYIGEQLARRLGIACYDSGLIRETAAESGFAPSFIEANEEQRPSSFLYSLVMGLSVPMEGQPLPIQLFQAQADTIRKIAAREESCILVGRCADYVLRDTEGLCNVFVHAPLQARVQRIMQRDQLEREAAEKSIQAKDKERATYYEFFSGQKWGLARNYHLSLDTSRVGIEGAVELICRYLELTEQGSAF